MRMKFTKVYVDNQDKALTFYTEVLGFVKKADFLLGSFRWLTVVSPDIEAFLRETQRYDIYHYVLTAIIASHSSQAWNLLLKVAQDEQEPERVQLLLSALALVQHDPAIEQLMRELQQKISLA